MHNAPQDNKIGELKRRVDEQCKTLGSLASSIEGENRLGELMRRVEKPCEALSSLAAGVGEGVGFVLSWPETRELFLQYVEFKRYEPANARNMIGYLDRFVKQPIKEPLDVMQPFSPLTAGQRHHLNRAMRAWFKCLEINRPNGQFKEFLEGLRKAIPKDEIGIDIKVPEEEQIVSDLTRLASDPLKYQVAYNLLLDSGLRLVEVVKLLNDFPEAERLEGFYRCPVGLFRSSKQAYYCYLTEYTFKQIMRLKEDGDPASLERRLKESFTKDSIDMWHKKHNYTRPKYLRKFANDMMTSERLNIPESVADFIQGRVPKSIGAKHYMKLKRKADQFYPRYAQYTTELRQKAGIVTA